MNASLFPRLSRGVLLLAAAGILLLLAGCHGPAGEAASVPTAPDGADAELPTLAGPDDAGLPFLAGPYDAALPAVLLDVPEQWRGRVYEDVQRMIYDALLDTEYRSMAAAVSENYTQLLEEAISYNEQYFRPVSAGIVPFRTYLDYAEAPEISVCVTTDKGDTLTLSLAEPTCAGSGGTVMANDRPYSMRLKKNEHRSRPEYELRWVRFEARLKIDGVEERIAEAIERSDWELDEDEKRDCVNFYIRRLTSLYTYDLAEYHPIRQISMVTPEEKMLSEAFRMLAPYAVELTDAEGNVIVIYNNSTGRPNFYSAIVNGSLVVYAITRL